MILNQTDFFARSATLDGAISDTDTQITLAGLSTRFTDAVAAGTAGYENGTGLGPFRISDDDGFELIAITDHVSGTTFELQRGIQGTDALAWADGTAVRAVVTRRVLRDTRNEGFTAFHGPEILYDRFDHPDGPLAGNVAETGQPWLNATLTGFDTDLSVSDGVVSGGHGAYIQTTIPDNFTAQLLVNANPTSSNSRHGVLIYVDDDNYLILGRRNREVAVIQHINANPTFLSSDAIIGGENVFGGPRLIEAGLDRREDGVVYSRYGGAIAFAKIPVDGDVEFILDNAIGIGIGGFTGAVHGIQVCEIT